MIRWVLWVRQSRPGHRCKLTHLWESEHSYGCGPVSAYPDVVETPNVLFCVVREFRFFAQHGAIGRLQQEAVAESVRVLGQDAVRVRG